MPSDPGLLRFGWLRAKTSEPTSDARSSKRSMEARVWRFQSIIAANPSPKRRQTFGSQTRMVLQNTEVGFLWPHSKPRYKRRILTSNSHE